MSIIWPLDLPQEPNQDGYSESPPNLLLRSKVDVGVPKVRPRGTAGVRPIPMEFTMTTAQTEILETFFESTLSNGALSFDFKNPRTQTTKTFRFVTPYAMVPAGGDYWTVTATMEQLP